MKEQEQSSAVIVQGAEGSQVVAQSFNNAFAEKAFDPATAASVETKGIEKAERSNVNIAFNYFKFDDVMGEPQRGVFLGTTMYNCVDTQTGEEKILPAVVWVDASQTINVCAATKLVSALIRLEPKTGFEATFTKYKTTTSGGKMQMFDIRILNLQQ